MTLSISGHLHVCLSHDGPMVLIFLKRSLQCATGTYKTQWVGWLHANIYSMSMSLSDLDIGLRSGSNVVHVYWHVPTYWLLKSSALPGRARGLDGAQIMCSLTCQRHVRDVRARLDSFSLLHDISWFLSSM